MRISPRSMCLAMALCVVGIPVAGACNYAANIFKPAAHRLTAGESKAMTVFASGRYSEARSLAEKVLRRQKDSYVAHFVMACVNRHAEGELMRALWHLKRARKHMRLRMLRIPAYTHRLMLFELISLLRQLGREKQAMTMIHLNDRLFPRYKLEDLLPWSLMKLHRYREAIAMAEGFLKKGKYRSSAYNALCAISFELGQRWRSLKYCKAAVDIDRSKNTSRDRTIHLSNLAEAHLALFDFAKAEQFALSATRYVRRTSHGNPWEFLVGVYLDQGRLNDGWNALKRARLDFLRQVPRLAESLFASNQMNQANFFLALGQGDLALKTLERIRDRPDRHGHTSAKVHQQIVGARLMRRRARLVAIEQMHEKASAYGVWGRIGSWWKRSWWRVLAWRDGTRARKAFAQGKLLEHTLSPYRSGGAVVPYRMIGDLIPLMGPAVIRSSVKKIRRKEIPVVPKIKGFLDMVEAEAAFVQGRNEEALRLSRLAMLGLSSQLKPMHDRLRLIRGEIWRRQGKIKSMRRAFSRVLQQNGSLFRVLRLKVPVSTNSPKGTLAKAALGMFLRSPRFSSHRGGFLLHAKERRVQGRAMIEVTLSDRGGTVLGRSHVVRKAKEKKDLFLQRVVAKAHQEFFSPQVEISRKEIFSLDNSLLRTPTHNIRWQEMFKKIQIK